MRLIQRHSRQTPRPLRRRSGQALDTRRGLRLDLEMPDSEPQTSRLALLAHVVPFVAWLGCMMVLGDPAGWKYALRTVLCLGLFVAFRPWRWYPRLDARHILPAVLTGVLVFVVWIAGESDVASRWPGLQAAYIQFGTMPSWAGAVPQADRVYAPETAGWCMTVMRIAGSAFVIALLEEFFFRGFLYRYLIHADFLKVDPGRMHRVFFVVVALVFAAEHWRWLAGLLAGLAYGLLMIRTRDIWAAGIAHAVTNLLLGIYVVWADQYIFWG